VNETQLSNRMLLLRVAALVSGLNLPSDPQQVNTVKRVLESVVVLLTLKYMVACINRPIAKSGNEPIVHLKVTSEHAPLDAM